MAIIARRQAGQQQRITDEATEVRKDVNQYGQSGRNMQAIGQSFGVVEEKFRELKDLNDYTTSSIEKDQRMSQLYSNLDSAMLNGEISPFEAEQKLKDESNKIFKETSSRVSNPKYRARFDLRASATVQSNVAKIQNVIRQQQIVETKEKFSVKSDELMKAILNSTSQNEKQDLLAEYDQMASDSAGLLYNANDISKLKENFRENLKIAQVEHDIEVNVFNESGLEKIKSELESNSSERYSSLSNEERLKYIKDVDAKLNANDAREKEQRLRIQEASTSSFLNRIIEKEDPQQIMKDLKSAVISETMNAEMAENLTLATLGPSSWRDAEIGSGKTKIELATLEPRARALFFAENIKDSLSENFNTRKDAIKRALSAYNNKEIDRAEMIFLLRIGAGLETEKEKLSFKFVADSVLNTLAKSQSLNTGGIIDKFLKHPESQKNPTVAIQDSIKQQKQETNPEYGSLKIGTEISSWNGTTLDEPHVVYDYDDDGTPLVMPKRMIGGEQNAPR